MDEFDYGLIADFLSANWSRFIAFARHEAGVREDACDALLEALNKLAERMP